MSRSRSKRSLSPAGHQTSVPLPAHSLATIPTELSRPVFLTTESQNEVWDSDLNLNLFSEVQHTVRNPWSHNGKCVCLATGPK